MTTPTTLETTLQAKARDLLTAGPVFLGDLHEPMMQAAWDAGSRDPAPVVSRVLAGMLSRGEMTLDHHRLVALAEPATPTPPAPNAATPPHNEPRAVALWYLGAHLGRLNPDEALALLRDLNTWDGDEPGTNDGPVTA